MQKPRWLSGALRLVAWLGFEPSKQLFCSLLIVAHLCIYLVIVNHVLINNNKHKVAIVRKLAKEKLCCFVR